MIFLTCVVEVGHFSWERGREYIGFQRRQFQLIRLILTEGYFLQVSAINVLLVLFLLIGMPVPQLHFLMSNVALIWTAITILAKMLYQLETIKSDYWYSNCTVGLGAKSVK